MQKSGREREVDDKQGASMWAFTGKRDFGTTLLEMRGRAG